LDSVRQQERLSGIGAFYGVKILLNGKEEER